MKISVNMYLISNKNRCHIYPNLGQPCMLETFPFTILNFQENACAECV